MVSSVYVGSQMLLQLVEVNFLSNTIVVLLWVFRWLGGNVAAECCWPVDVRSTTEQHSSGRPLAWYLAHDESYLDL